MTYLDFDLLILRSGRGYRAKVINSPCGQATGAKFTLPFSPIELDNFWLRVGRQASRFRSTASAEDETVKAFGQKLFVAVFDDALQNCLYRSLDESIRQGAKGLRIRLRMTDTPEIGDLPWEYLYNPQMDDFLALSVETPIVRYLDVRNSHSPLSILPPLNILVMVSSPNDAALLDVEQEWGNLRKELKELENSGRVKLDRLDQATPLALQRKLRQKQYHVFHFIGHGQYSVQQKNGMLILADDHEQSHLTTSQDIGVLLRDHRSIRLVVLNSCEGARCSPDDAYSGVAQYLIRKGIPAVIAMQFEITDSAAITFAREFYGALADNYPVDAALTEARKTIFTQGNKLEWGTPVLYLSSTDGRIFCLPDISQDESQPPTALTVTKNASLASSEGGPQHVANITGLFSAVPIGPLEHDSPFYIERPGDRRVTTEIKKAGVGSTIVIKGPRQVGKTSLLLRATAIASSLGKRIAMVDFQEIGETYFNEFERFLVTFCNVITEELGMFSRIKDYWNPDQPVTMRCTNYVGNYVLKELGCPLVVALDEVERVFESEFRSDFFSMLRGWHSRRARPGGRVWKDLDLIIVTSTEPHYFIRNLARSPFNVSEPIKLSDFDAEQASTLNARYGQPLSLSQMRELIALVGGHPYLMHHAIHAVASGSIDSFENLFVDAQDERNPFRDYLFNLLMRLREAPDMLSCLGEVIRTSSCRDAGAFYRLHGAGLVRQVGDRVTLRCELYKKFLREYLNV